jgi:hypothetical protein
VWSPVEATPAAAVQHTLTSSARAAGACGGGARAGPFTVLPQSAQPHQAAVPAGQPDEDEAAEPVGAAAAGGSSAALGSSGSTAVTHLAPPGLRRSLEHSTKAFPLAFGLFETFLGARFPYPALHQVLAPAHCTLLLKPSLGDCMWLVKGSRCMGQSGAHLCATSPAVCCSLKL